MKRKVSLMMTVLMLFVSSVSFVYGVTYQTVDISSGIKADMPGNPLYSPNDLDNFWKVILTPNGTNLGSAFVPVKDVAWDVLPQTAYINSNQSLAGIYEYERCFCLQNPEKAVLDITVRV
ncbi:MAG: hypothetical protein MUC29_14180, partial [Pyrinomonadaceae bacterium]|nr:hypothetical protein [Pyrinomonadaceae bacterium]